MEEVKEVLRDPFGEGKRGGGGGDKDGELGLQRSLRETEKMDGSLIEGQATNEGTFNDKKFLTLRVYQGFSLFFPRKMFFFLIERYSFRWVGLDFYFVEMKILIISFLCFNVYVSNQITPTKYYLIYLNMWLHKII